jgi:diguanylate cyclase (GGDEF)-like protein
VRTRQRWLTSSRYGPTVLAVLLTALYLVWTQTELGGPAVTLAFSDTIIGLAAAAAGVACIAASRWQDGTPGRGWLLMGVGMLCWALGEAVWTTYEVVLGREVPFPSLADAGFLLMVPLTLVGMAAMLRFHRRALRTLLDAFMVAGSLLFVSWPIVLEPTYLAGGQGMFARSIALAYPIGDIVTASMAFVLLSQTPKPKRGTLALAGSGMLALAVADSGFAYLTVHETYSSANVIDTGWFAGFLLLALAGLRACRPEVDESRQTMPLLVALPYVPLSAAMITCFVLQVTRGTIGTFLFATLMVLVALVVLRQVLTLRENLTLTRQLHSTVEELRHREAELRDLAYHDPLTGLANRTLLQQRTERAVDRSATDSQVLGVLYIDLDNFKQVNDGFGHPVGDALLVAVAGRLRACTRERDTIARLGGDEFAMLLDGLTEEFDAEMLARRVVAELSRPFTVDGHTVRISASVGVAVQPAGPVQAGELLRNADLAMYNAKFNGKNNLARFDALLHDRITQG